jgi:hypothetical protein
MGIGGQSFGHVATETTGRCSNEIVLLVFFIIAPFRIAPSRLRP